MEFIMTVGLPASGKSTWAHNQENHLVLDSDAIREELWGDAGDQQNPAKVFELMFRRTCNAMASGRSVIYCATNITMRYRVHTLNQLKRKFPYARFRCVVFNTPVNICKQLNKKREREVPDAVIEKLARCFQMPIDNEGWDEIEIVRPVEYDGKQFSCKMWEEIKAFGSQENPHHTLSLFDHMVRAIESVDIYAFDNDEDSREVITAAAIHDIGKAYTKSYDENGVAHYFNHAELGAYLAMNMGAPRQVVEIVNYHMCPFMDENARKAWQTRLGEKLWHKVEVLHEADVLAK